MSTDLRQRIGFWAALSIVVGSIIGSGVFMKPSAMALQLGSPVALTLIWVVAGVFSFMGALIFSELGAMFPETGGIYVYFRKLFGERTAFLYGWAAFAVINTASVAAISFVCAYYANDIFLLPHFNEQVELSVRWHIPLVGDLYPLKDAGVKAIAIFITLLLTWLNYRSVRSGAAFQLVSTVVKILALTLLIGGIFFFGNGNASNFFHAVPENEVTATALISAMTGAFFAYDGWINLSFMAGEIKQPGRNIPASLAGGVLICILIYVGVNQAYLFVMPVQDLAGSSLVAADAVRVALGSTSGILIAAMIVICTLGAVNGNAMASARVTYAMGQSGAFSKWAGATHPRFQTPGNALWLHAIWACLFIVTGSFDMLADMFVFITWVSYGLGALGLLLLRRRYARERGSFRVPGHPYVTAIFILFTLVFLVVTVYNDISNYLQNRQPVVNSVLGMMITLAGFPLYYYFRKKNRVSSSSSG